MDIQKLIEKAKAHCCRIELGFLSSGDRRFRYSFDPAMLRYNGVDAVSDIINIGLKELTY